MIVASVIIITSLIKSGRNLSAIRKDLKPIKTDLDVERNNQVNFKLIETSSGLSKQRSVQRKRNTSFNVSAKAKNVSAMLVTNNLIFITLTLPIVVFLSVTPPISTVCDYEKARLLFVKVICIILMNSNCTINIFIYNFMSSQFRMELQFILGKVFGFVRAKDITMSQPNT